MGFRSFLIKQLLPEKWGNSFFYPRGLADANIFGSQNDKQNLKDYLEIPEINIPVNYLAWAQSLAEIQVVSKTTNKPISNSEPIVKVLRSPNFFQTQRELWRQTQIFRSVFGNEYIFFLTPIGMSRSYKAMYALPPQFMKVQYPQKSIPFFFNTEFPEDVKYTYEWSGQKYPIDKNSLIHLNDNNANIKEDNYLEGRSKLETLRPNTRNIRAAYEARNVILENRGAIGILSNRAKDAIGSTMPMNPKEKEDLQKEMSNYGVLKRQWQYVLTNLSLSWQQITTDLDKLRVFEEVEADFKTICNAYGTPFELFSQSSSYENKLNAEKQLYQDTVIPTTQERIQAVNDFLEVENRSWHVIATFDHLPIFQEDIKERSESLNTLINALNAALSVNAISIEDYKKELEKFNLGK